MRSSAAQHQSTARAYANFALVKYWGKRNIALNLPDVGSISITLDALYSTTTVMLDRDLAADQLLLNGQTDVAAQQRAVAVLDRLRAMAGVETYCRIDSTNNFPTGAGLASSASGFAALVSAAVDAMRVDCSLGQQSQWARIGSGSAARSIFGGFVEMHKGKQPDGRDSIAEPILDGDEWPLEVVIAISQRGKKAVGSTEGMQRTANTSPFYRAWVEHQPVDLELARNAIRQQDFEALVSVAEGSALAMHGLAMSARPGLLYFNATTMACLHRVIELRADGVPVFFTVDAGPQVKAICLPGSAAEVASALGRVDGVTEVLTSRLGPGAHRLERA
ncbi:MAG: diphosphomevalonate decarboxylase [Pseudomonadota bacterium]